MYKVFNAILTIIWICDIANFPQLEFLDTTYPINGWVWFFIWMFLPSCDENKSKDKE